MEARLSQELVPRIETERLFLRAHRLEDFEDAARMWADPMVTRFIGGKPFTEQETWTKILRYLGHWHLMKLGYWAIEEKASTRFIGELGFADFRRDLQPRIDGIPELGWALASSAHGKGFAKEALKAVQQWGDRHLKSRRTVCIIAPQNVPSVSLAMKFSYRKVVDTRYAGEPVGLFERIVP